MWDMQRDVYRLKPRSRKAVGLRTAMVRSFFLDMELYGRMWMDLSAFQVTVWVRGRVVGGSSSAAALVKLTLILVEVATDVKLHSTHPLVQGQLTNSAVGPVALEPEAQAKEIDIDIMVKLQRFAHVVPTDQLRCYCGFFV